MQLEIVVAGTPEQVWDAIATSAGVSAWMQPTWIEPRAGGSYAFDLVDGAGPNDSGGVVRYDRPNRFATAGVEWKAPGSDDPAALATEWTVAARDGSTCLVRIVMSGFGPGQAWDDEIDGLTAGIGRSLDRLAAYLHRRRCISTGSAADSRLGLAHCRVGPVIPVSDLGRSIAFYRDTLGLPGEPAPSGFRLRAAGDSVAYLLSGTDYAGQAGWPLASFATENLDGVVADLSRRGVPTLTDVPYDVDDRGIAAVEGMLIAWFADPDGQIVSVFELSPGKPDADREEQR